MDGHTKFSKQFDNIPSHWGYFCEYFKETGPVIFIASLMIGMVSSHGFDLRRQIQIVY